MIIQIIATSVETKPSSNGKTYQQLEVTFKNLSFPGKVESKKLMSFGANAGAFKTLSNAGQGSTWEVTVVKNAQGYNDWTAVEASNGAAPEVPQAATAAKAQIGGRSTYETPEERAQRQVFIVRQSSVSSALTLHSMGAKNPAKLEEVLDTAQKICDFVFGVKDTGPSGFADLPDFDIPQVE